MERSETKHRDWKPQTEDPLSVDIENRMHLATEICTYPADIESLDTYEERIGDFKAKGLTYPFRETRNIIMQRKAGLSLLVTTR